MNLDKLIDQWIGEEKIPNPNGNSNTFLSYINGHNSALQDLKSRKQELIEGIVGIIEIKKQQNIKCEMEGKNKQLDEIIKDLTGK